MRNVDVGLIFQSFNLIGDMTVYENVEYPLTLRGVAAGRSQGPRRHRARARRAGRARQAAPGIAVRRPPAARRHRPRHRRPPADRARRRADRQPRFEGGEAVMQMLEELHAGGVDDLPRHPQPGLHRPHPAPHLPVRRPRRPGTGRLIHGTVTPARAARTVARYTRLMLPFPKVRLRAGPRPDGRVRLSHAAADVAAPQRAHRLRRPREGGDVPARRLLQDPRPDEQVRAADRRAEAARRDLLVGRQPRAGRRARRRALRHQGGRLHGRERHAVEDRGDARLRRRGRPARHDLGRGQREGEAARRREGLHLHPSVRRRAADPRAGDGGSRDLPGLARGGAGDRSDRRRRPDLGRRRRRSRRAIRRSR